jgi:hypothetical protein
VYVCLFNNFNIVAADLQTISRAAYLRPAHAFRGQPIISSAGMEETHAPRAMFLSATRIPVIRATTVSGHHVSSAGSSNVPERRPEKGGGGRQL